ncbi:hypothetical protein PICSAR104_02579 [Mycobacterium avium subsp. paratuberculosis]|nr:hypothetical protein PICSAR104_02579 [Mycobacterium avium subsp. paratuberculosis]CAG6997044.1 hypothetical protein PICSAR154_03116 [Mycobacterium avium subsp. paratuberculosis]CAG7032368.1 hypothetical protein PICSAR172_00255 [Mycobacterium avium subsp. paratuberculosis]CAG7131137.1 hypothetical protein PICSAR232_00191 [Mycobacterium avium subsp. paratuberculosis]CAG7139339.1 hypothetical protein PICSAR252_00281 [Mycobacterium avium subsp. paratuberculosis]
MVCGRGRSRPARALDRDCAELRAAGVVAAEALRLQRAQVAELAVAWTGAGGEAAVQLLQRHCDTAEALATELRAAAQRCESLRDNLWYLIDAKAATAIAVDDRTRAQRPEWLAAAAAVTAGQPDRDDAHNLIRQQVIPYVDNDIRNEWLPAMRSATDGVQTSYAMVVDRMAAAPAARFEFPGDLGSGLVPVPATRPLVAAPMPPLDAAPTLPDAAPTLPAAVSEPAAAATLPAAVPSPAAAPAADWGAALGDAAGMPAGDLGGLAGSGMGSGLGSGLGGGGGLLGLAGKIVDAMGGLLGSVGDGLDGADPFGDQDPLDDNAFHGDPFHADDPADAKDAGDDADETAADEPAAPDRPAPAGEAEPNGEPAPSGEAPPTGEPAQPVAATPPAAPPPGAPPPGAPCQIAADQLPQAGQ